MKKNLIFFYVVASAILLLSISSCGKNEPNEGVETNYVSEITGSPEFFESISCIQNLPTKAGEVSIEEITEAIQPLFVSAKAYLTSNGYDYHEDFSENDPNIILTAYALMEADFYANKAETKITVTSFLSCVFLGESVGDLAGTGAALLAKRFAKKILQRAIPYVGAAAAVVSTGYCLYENW